MLWLRQHLVLPFLLYTSLLGGAEQPKCRCLYGDPCWPTQNEFTNLANQLSQPLLRPVPPPSACYPTNMPSRNCSEVVAHYTDGNWRADQPGAMQNTNFESFVFLNGTIDACYLNVSLNIPCEQGNVPPVSVDVRSAEDVQAAVVFAKRHNLRLVVKNTGHDYLGRSAGRGAFMVWTHHLKNMSYDANFTPSGAPGRYGAVEVVTLGAGVQWHEAYTFVSQQNRTIVGGISQGGSVGAAGGWVMGAGHSAFSPTFGLGVDNVVQFTLVLADGMYVTANAFQNVDLFWALRGGGGGTYGVVISTTYRVHPAFSVGLAAISTNFPSYAAALAVVTEWTKLHPTISDAGWGGYTYINQVGQADFQMMFVSPNVSIEEATATFKPLFDIVGNATEGQAVAVVRSYPTFLDWYTAFFTLPGQSQVGGRVELASRLLPKAITMQDPEKVANILLSLKAGVGINSVGGGAVSKVDPSSTGLNPSWRKALAEVYISETWEEGASAATIAQARERLKQNTDVIDKLTTDSGSYLNEGSLYEKDFKKSYFGSHYVDLKGVKKKYDPTSLFVVASGVGSEYWDEELKCRL
ncbi:FAD binding domain-containing protein [Agrocybe pediades]|nr:FAD binding domain-containing protein [Agrocybe pediades]